jgi:hypothetical protein
MPRTFTEAEKQVLRDRLAAARAKRSKMAAERRERGDTAPPRAPKPKTEAAAAPAPTDFELGEWTETRWLTGNLAFCQDRVARLRAEFEKGCRLLGQRPDINSPANYRCFVCGSACTKWIWRNDYLNLATHLFESIVIDTDLCHTKFCNSPVLQARLKALINGGVAA